MAVRVAINGFGRIGRLVLRAALEAGRKDLEFVAINDLGSAEANAYLLKYDSVHGTFPGKISATKKSIKVNGAKIQVLAERDPAKLPWDELGIDVVMECTGLFTTKDSAGKHLVAGAKKVLVSAPCSDADQTVVYGVNHGKLKKRDKVVSNASCTTNCLVPVARARPRDSIPPTTDKVQTTASTGSPHLRYRATSYPSSATKKPSTTTISWCVRATKPISTKLC